MKKKKKIVMGGIRKISSGIRIILAYKTLKSSDWNNFDRFTGILRSDWELNVTQNLVQMKEPTLILFPYLNDLRCTIDINQKIICSAAVLCNIKAGLILNC